MWFDIQDVGTLADNRFDCCNLLELIDDKNTRDFDL